jgi:hypothetical protein
MIILGFPSTDVDLLARQLETLLGVQFEDRESSYRGGAYCYAMFPQGQLYLQTNFDLLDDEPFEENWPEKQAILYLCGPDNRAWQPTLDQLRSTATELGRRFG